MTNTAYIVYKTTKPNDIQGVFSSFANASAYIKMQDKPRQYYTLAWELDTVSSADPDKRYPLGRPERA